MVHKLSKNPDTNYHVGKGKCTTYEVQSFGDRQVLTVVTSWNL